VASDWSQNREKSTFFSEKSTFFHCFSTFYNLLFLFSLFFRVKKPFQKTKERILQMANFPLQLARERAQMLLVHSVLFAAAELRVNRQHEKESLAC
jgi:hypothetical protein